MASPARLFGCAVTVSPTSLLTLEALSALTDISLISDLDNEWLETRSTDDDTLLILESRLCKQFVDANGHYFFSPIMPSRSDLLGRLAIAMPFLFEAKSWGLALILKPADVDNATLLMLDFCGNHDAARKAEDMVRRFLLFLHQNPADETAQLSENARRKWQAKAFIYPQVCYSRTC